jgi:hypothetical protein
MVSQNMAIDIDFEMTVDAKGYRLEHGRVVGRGGPKRRMRLKDFPTLYLEFAKVQTPEALLQFVNRFGRLTLDTAEKGQDGLEIRSAGDDARLVLGRAKMLSTSFEMLRGHMGNPPKWEGGKFEYEAAGLKISGCIPLPAKLSAALAPDPMTGVWQLRLQPPTLLDAIWLQVGQAIVSKADLKQCNHCGKWFEAGAASDRRRDAKFCSRECKIAFHSLERSRKPRDQRHYGIRRS